MNRIERIRLALEFKNGWVDKWMDGIGMVWGISLSGVRRLLSSILLCPHCFPRQGVGYQKEAAGFPVSMHISQAF